MPLARPPSPALLQPAVHSTSTVGRQQHHPTAVTADRGARRSINAPETFRSHATHHSTPPTPPSKHAPASGGNRPPGPALFNGEENQRLLEEEDRGGHWRGADLLERSEEPLRRSVDGGGGSDRSCRGGEGNCSPGVGSRGASAAGGREDSSSLSAPPPSEKGAVVLVSPPATMAMAEAAAVAAVPPAAGRTGLDLLALDPAAREYFLSQQRQLSALEEQLHRLQAAMRDQQRQQLQPMHQPMQQQQQQLQQPTTMSVDHLPRLSVSSPAATTGPMSTVRASNANAAVTMREQTGTQSPPPFASMVGSELTDARTASTVEAGTNTSFSWAPHRPLPTGVSHHRATAADTLAAIVVDAAGPSTGTTADPPRTTPAVVDTLQTEPLHNGPGTHRTVKGGGRRLEEDGGDCSSPSGGINAAPAAPHRGGESTGPTATAAAAATAPGWTTQRGRHAFRERRQGQRRQRRPRDGYRSQNSGQGEDDEGEDDSSPVPPRSSSPEIGFEEEGLEAPSLSLLRLFPGARSHDHSHPPPASEDDKASGTTQEEEEEEEEGGEKEQINTAVAIAPDHETCFENALGPRSLGEDAAARRERVTTGNGDGLTGGGGKLRQQRQLRERQRRHRLSSLVVRRGGDERTASAVVPPIIIPIADLVVVPRIEFGQLTDDEMSSDLDEGEVRVRFIILCCYYFVLFYFYLFLYMFL